MSLTSLNSYKKKNINTKKKKHRTHKLTEFFDNNWEDTLESTRKFGHFNRSLMSQDTFLNDHNSSYDTSESLFNNSTVNFEKSQTFPAAMPGRTNLGLIGSQIIHLENNNDGGVFGRVLHEVNTEKKTNNYEHLPPTLEQQEIEQSEAKKIVQNPNRSENYLIATDDGFQNYGIKPRQYKAINPPKALEKLKQENYLLTPNERREILEFERDVKKAEMVIRKAKNDKQKRDFLMTHHHEPYRKKVIDQEGNILSKDSLNSEREEKRLKNLEQHHLLRKSKINLINNSKERFGYDILHHTNEPPQQPDHFIKRKGARQPPQDNFKRLFHRPEKPLNDKRRDRLRNIELASHGPLKYYPSTDISNGPAPTEKISVNNNAYFDEPIYNTNNLVPPYLPNKKIIQPSPPSNNSSSFHSPREKKYDQTFLMLTSKKYKKKQQENEKNNENDISYDRIIPNNNNNNIDDNSIKNIDQLNQSYSNIEISVDNDDEDNFDEDQNYYDKINKLIDNNKNDQDDEEYDYDYDVEDDDEYGEEEDNDYGEEEEDDYDDEDDEDDDEEDEYDEDNDYLDSFDSNESYDGNHDQEEYEKFEDNDLYNDEYHDEFYNDDDIDEVNEIEKY